jgi:hypothetical protein
VQLKKIWTWLDEDWIYDHQYKNPAH